MSDREFRVQYSGNAYGRTLKTALEIAMHVREALADKVVVIVQSLEFDKLVEECDALKAQLAEANDKFAKARTASGEVINNYETQSQIDGGRISVMSTRIERLEKALAYAKEKLTLKHAAEVDRLERGE